MKKLLLLFSLFVGFVSVLSACDNTDVFIDETPNNINDITPDNDDVVETETFEIIYYDEQDNIFTIQTIFNSDLATKPDDPIKEMYAFEYWTLDSAEFSFNTIIDSNIQLYAKWQLVTPTVHLYNGDILLESVEVKINSTFNSFNTFVEEGSNEVFKGWFLEADFTEKFNSSLPITDNLTLYGKWETVEIEEPVIDDPILDLEITEDGLYTSKDEVALYIATYHKLPSNYMTKAEANGDIRNIWNSTNKASIGGDVFGNREGLLPSEVGRTFTELDIDYNGGSRGAKRIVFSSDFRIFYTDDHYDSFVEYDKETKEWKSY